MLSQRLLQHTRHTLAKNTTRTSGIVFNKAQRYHSLHEDQASVLPNKVETASSSFKVSKIYSKYIFFGIYLCIFQKENAEKMQKLVDDLNLKTEKIKLGKILIVYVCVCVEITLLICNFFYRWW